MNTLKTLEESITIFLQAHLSETMISFLKVMANFGDEAALIVIIGFLYWCYDKKTGKKLILYLSIANIFYPMIKNVVKRVRPYMVNDKIQCFKPAYDGDAYDITVQGYSFPSGHMVNCACVYGEMFKRYLNKILRVLIVVLIILVGLSRICLGVHYLSDVIVGFIFGLFICYILDKLLNKYDKKIVYLVLIILGGTGFIFCKSNDFYMGYGMMIGSMAADLFEEKYINFEGTNNILEIIIRMLIGILLFVLVSKGSKLPFTEEFLNSKTTLSFLVRAIRYFLIVFLVIGVYPICFKFMHFKKNK